jgi:hypothetical protein
MGVLDIILLKDLVTDPVTVNTEYISETIDVSFREDEFAIQVNWENGLGVDMEIFLEASNDNVNYAPMSSQAIEDESGMHMFDVGFCGAVFIRIRIEVSAGSIDLTGISYRAKRRH